jgi:hypothetical protein
MNTFTRLSLVLLIGACASACERSGATAPASNDSPVAQVAPSNPEGEQFKEALLAAIAAADRIVIAEHSSEMDDEAALSRHLDDQTIPLPAMVTYEEKELTQAQRGTFAASIRSMPAAAQEAFPACVMETHHTLRFYSGSELKSTMQVCFKCGQFNWDGSTLLPPAAVVETMHGFVSSIGMTPKRDWPSYLAQHRAQKR